MGPRFWVVPALTTLTLVALGAGALLGLALLVPRWRRGLARLGVARPRLLLGGAFVVALTATGGSLFISEVLGMLPCELCWYQRIAMYPLVVVLGVALIRRDGAVWLTALPLAAVGLATSLYHVVIQLVPQAQGTQCAGSVPCTARYFVAYGFVSIPVMAGAAFLLVILLVSLQALGGAQKSVRHTP